MSLSFMQQRLRHSGNAKRQALTGVCTTVVENRVPCGSPMLRQIDRKESRATIPSLCFLESSCQSVDHADHVGIVQLDSNPALASLRLIERRPDRSSPAKPYLVSLGWWRLTLWCFNL